MRATVLLAFAVGIAACGQAEPPAVAQREPRLDADDLAVMKALLDDRIRPEQMKMRQRGGSGAVPPQAPRLLVVDTTVPVCQTDPGALGAPPGGCLYSDWLAEVYGVLPMNTQRTAVSVFLSRNVRSLPIGAPLGANVSFVSATLPDMLSSRALLQTYPLGSAIVSFSAPIYPAPRVAVIAYYVRPTARGAARLRQEPDGRWKLDSRGLRESVF